MNTFPVNYVELESIYQSLEKYRYQCISLSGAHGSCGTSMMAYALAKRYQANGYKVLLIDVNLHQPSLDKRLGLIRQDWQVGQDNKSAIYAPSVEGTDFLSAPLSNTASSSFRDPVAIQHSVAEWLTSYDRVIFDTSPISTSNYRDIPTNLICAAADASILMIKSEFTSQAILQECCDKFAQANANLIGVVMNDMDFPSLADEMLRETQRISTHLPWLQRALQKFIRQSGFLNFRA
ncbi:tyrosine-protein kinase family protein [Marinomonas transparens]|uniref:Uncharacterized protein n=1 Tax=Marinomonas transparens TaxID=2795388 RepID=A0A934JM02_9GAMM|nr:hypothetical protein [Marinomonas transparens]MBJ7538261.1 hypothetical protein [Marinomonas transparens]